jgi:hypothetical protein
MRTNEKRAILERLAQGTISMDEAENQLALLDDPDPVTSTPTPTRVLPVHDSSASTEVHIELNSSGEIDIVGNADALEPYLEGPHSVEVNENDGVFEVHGQLGDDGLLVIPADVELTLEANGGSLSLHGIRGSLIGELNVGRADIHAAFTRGQSRIDANVGKLHISLHPDSTVRVQVSSATSIRVSDDLVKTGRGMWTYGDGQAGLEIAGNISRLVIDVDLGDMDADELRAGVDLTDTNAR